MRRILIAITMSLAVVVVAPTGAMAEHHGSHHHARHHARHQARHRSSSRRHSRVRHERFGRSDQNQPGNTSGPAGTVTSFDNGVLTITLNDGSTVSGAVTDQTELECMAPTSNPQGEDGNGDNDGNSSGDGDHQGSSGSSGDDNGGNGDNGDNGDNGNDNGNDNGQMCSTSSLTPGTPVAEANLEISGSGATWNKVELITS